MSALLQMSHLRTHLLVPRGALTPVDDVSFSVEARKTVALVGESGCGKSMTALSVMGLLPRQASIVAGEIRLDDEELVSAPADRRRALRGRRVAMIFQEPMTSLNPALRIGDQIAEGRMIHFGESSSAARKAAVELLRQVGIADAADRASAHPHQLSGGMRQRVMIAMALACDPALLIADEPTTALDVTVQAQILELLREAQRARGMGLLLITHDLSVVAEAADEISVMYAGRIVEQGPTREVLKAPAHPYTAALLRSMPRVSASDAPRAERRLPAIPGSVPRLDALPTGCRFRDRCDRALERCAREDPPLAPPLAGAPQTAACHNPVPPPGAA